MTLKKCEECPLAKNHGDKIAVYQNGQRVALTTQREVPYRGPKENVDVVIVGESPAPFEMHHNKIFAGETGDLVEKEFRKNGVNTSQMFFANSCRCMLSKDDKTNKKSMKKAMECCRPMLMKALELLRPKLVVCFGDVALQQVLKQSGVTKKRGIPQWSADLNCWVFPTFHPSACLRDQGKFAFWRPDMAYIARFIKDGFKLKETANSGQYSDVESIQFLLDKQSITCALDTETQGLDWNDPNSVVISYSVTDEEDKGYNIWLWQECALEESERTIKWPRKIGKKYEAADVPIRRVGDYDKKIAELRELCARPDIKIVMHNGNYDLHRLRQLGIVRDAIKSYTMDTQTAIHALDPDNFIKASLLDTQTALLHGKADHKTSFQKDVDKSDMLKAAKEDPTRHTNYAAADTDVTLCCANVLRKRLLDDKALANYYVNLAHPVQSEVLYDIEKNGILFDSSKLPETKNTIAEIMRRLEGEFLALVPSAIKSKHEAGGLKLTRSAFLRDVFFDRKGFHLPVLKKTPTGDPTMDRKVLIRVRDDLEDGEAKEALNKLIEWGPYQKLYSTYLKGFEAVVKPDGRLHTQITKTGTATGRSASSNPNLQNVPKRTPEIARAIRSMLCAAPGKVLVACDYSQSELRWIAHESGDKNMIDIFLRGDDMHKITGMDLAAKRGHKWDELDKTLQKKFRQDAKPVNFGFPYGQSARGFQSYARDQYGVAFTLEEAELYRHLFLYESYPGLVPWHERRIAEALRNGFVRSAYGFIRRTPDIHNGELFKRGEAERIAVNTGIQSASNDSTLLGALEFHRSGLVNWKRAQIVLFIHDELIYEVEEDYVDEFTPLLITQLENISTEKFGFKLRVPLVAEAKIGKNLAEMKDFAA